MSTQAPDSFLRVRLAAFALMCVALSVKGDGSFPLPDTVPDAWVQAVTLAFGALFFAGMCFFVNPHPASGFPPARCVPSGSWFPWALLALFIAGSSVITVLAARRFAPHGYVLSMPVLGAVSLALLAAAVAGAMCAWDARRLFRTGLAAYVLFTAYAIVFFPLSPERSDMLPLIQQAVARMLAGLDPYVRYGALDGIPLTYLPGLWLAHVPGAALGLDPRWTEMAAVAAAALVVFAGVDRARRPLVAACLALFLSSPYLVYRHEIYIGVLLLALALTARDFHAKRWVITGVFFGWSMAASQFAWVIAPLLVIHLLRAEGVRPTLIFLASSTVVALALLLPSFILSPLFMHSVLLSWGARLYLSGFNLVYWLEPLVGLKGVVACQVLTLAAWYVVALRARVSTNRTFVLAAFALACFFLFNRVVWVYFFLFPPFVLLMGTMSVRLQQRDG